MRTTVTAPLTHLCPHVDERDIGTITLTWDGEAPELHELAALLASFADKRTTHEALTERIASATGAAVTTKWRTANLNVECSV